MGCKWAGERAVPQGSSRLHFGLHWWLRRWRICLQGRRPRFDPWVGKIPWKRKWLRTPVFLAGKSHGQRSLVGYSLWGYKEDTTEQFMPLYVDWTLTLIIKGKWRRGKDRLFPVSSNSCQAYITSFSFLLDRRVFDPMRSNEDCHRAYWNQQKGGNMS